MKLSKKQQLHFVVGLLLAVLAELFIPVQFGLTVSGKHFLAIFIALIYLWMTVDTFIPSVMAIAAFGVMQVTKSSAIFSGAFGNSTVAIFLFACLMINAARECGVMNKIALWFMSRRATAGHPNVFLLCLALANFVLGALVTSVYSLMVTCPLLLSICERLGYKKGDKFYVSVFLLSMWSVLSGAIALPFAKAIYLSLEASLSAYGYTISYGQIMLMGVPVGLIWCLLGIVVVRLVIKPDFSKFMAYDPSELEAEMKREPLDKRGKIISCGFFVMIALWCTTIFSGVFPFAAYLNTIGFHVIGCLVLSVLCLIQLEDGPVINLRKLIPGLSWPIVGFLAMIMFTSSAFSSTELGIKDFLINLLSPIFANTSPALLVVIGIIVAGILTNVMSNVVTCVVTLNVFLPLLLSVSDLGGISPVAFSLATTVVAGMSCVTPSAFAGAPLIFGEHVSMGESLKPNCIMMLLGICLSVAAVFVF